MSNEMLPYGNNLPIQKLPNAAPALASSWTRQGRAMARSDRSAELEARNDYNDARLAVHRTHLATIVEKTQAQSRAELVQDTLLHVQAVDTLVGQLSAGQPALELILRDIQNSFNLGESQRIMRRSRGI